MAYFAELDQYNVVLRTIKVSNTDAPDPAPGVSEPLGLDFIANTLSLPGVWKQTSFNSRGGVHYLPNSWAPSGQPHLRYNFAEVGFSYDAGLDAFVPPQPFPSWVLNPDTALWDAPVPMPIEGRWYWDEPSVSWVFSS